MIFALPSTQTLLQQHAERGAEHFRGTETRGIDSQGQRGDVTADPLENNPPGGDVIADIAAARVATKAERRCQAQGKQSRRSALQTCAKVPPCKS